MAMAWPGAWHLHSCPQHVIRAHVISMTWYENHEPGEFYSLENDPLTCLHQTCARLGQEAGGGGVQQVRGGRVREHPRLQRLAGQVHRVHQQVVHKPCAAAAAALPARPAAGGPAGDVAADRKRAGLGAEADEEGARRALGQQRLRHAPRHRKAADPARAGRVPCVRALPHARSRGQRLQPGAGMPEGLAVLACLTRP